MNAKHTPGPWSIHADELGFLYIEGAGESCVYDSDQPEAKPMSQADARLIVAAPDLLAACQEALRVQTLPFDHPDKRDLPKVLRAAIANARGAS